MAPAKKPGPEEVRAVIGGRVEELGYPLNQLSRELGHTDAYMHQYLGRNKSREPRPVELDWRDLFKLRNLLGIPMQALGIDLPLTLIPLLAEVMTDVRLVDPAEWTGLYPLPPIAAPLAYFEVLTHVLNEHPRHAVVPGDLLVIDQDKGLRDLSTGDIALAVLAERKENGAGDGMHATLIVREFVAPHLLITNAMSGNHILNIADAALSFQVLLVGKLAYIRKGS